MTKLHLYFETMAGTHLGDAIRALRDSGSADALYEPTLRSTAPEGISWEEASLARNGAEGQRVTYSRRGLLFAAFAAEAYANDFLYERWDGQNREALQRMSTVDKYVLLPILGGAGRGLDRGALPLQKVAWLFKRRDELVHAVPETDLTYKPESHNPDEVAKCIVAVADAVEALNAGTEKGSVVSYVRTTRAGLLAYGQKAASELPDIHDAPSPVDLLLEAKRREWAPQD